MAYGHQWLRSRCLDPSRFEQAIRDCKQICDALPIPLGNRDGKGEPVFTPTEICLNGFFSCPDVSNSGDGFIFPSAWSESVAPFVVSPINGEYASGLTASARCVNSAGDGSFEPFLIKQSLGKKTEPNNDFVLEYCRTNYRPYDLAVQCCLIIFNHYHGDQFIVRSDGCEDHWYEASNDCQAVLGYGLEFSLEK